MKEIKEDFTKNMEGMEKMKSFCRNVSDAAAAGAGIAKNLEECLQDIAAMNRMISLCTNVMEHELGIGMGLHANKKATHKALCNNYVQKQKYTKKWLQQGR